MNSDASVDLLDDLDEKWDLVVEDQSDISDDALVITASCNTISTNCGGCGPTRGPDSAPLAR
jgi:hypothetical protein